MAKLTLKELGDTARKITGNHQVMVARWRNNGAITYDEASGFTYYILHSTAVVTYGHRDRIAFAYLDTGGYSTLTTRKAMNEALEAIGGGFAPGVSSGGKKSANVYKGVPFERTLLLLRHKNGDLTAQPDNGTQQVITT